MLQMWKLKNCHGAKMEVHVGDASTVLYNVPSKIDSKRSLQKSVTLRHFTAGTKSIETLKDKWQTVEGSP